MGKFYRRSEGEHVNLDMIFKFIYETGEGGVPRLSYLTVNEKRWVTVTHDDASGMYEVLSKEICN